MQNKRIPSRHHKKSSPSTERKLDSVLKSALISLLCTLGISFALLFASTVALMMTEDPTSFVDLVGYASIFVSAIIGGLVCSKLDKRAPYLTSILCGVGFVLLSMLFSFALPHSLASGMKTLVRLGLHALSLLFFPIGTLISIKMSKPRRKIKKRR